MLLTNTFRKFRQWIINRKCIESEDAEYIFEQPKVIEEILTKVPGTIDIQSNWYKPVTRLDIDIDQQLA